MEENTLRLQELNKLVAEARKMVEYLRIKRTALYFRERRVDMQTWMLNNLVDDACCDLTKKLEDLETTRERCVRVCRKLACLSRASDTFFG